MISLYSKYQPETFQDSSCIHSIELVKHRVFMEQFL